MKALSWIGKRIQARVEAMPSVQAMKERQERVAPVRRAVYGVAQRAIEDAAAMRELEEKLAGKEAEVVELLTDRSFMVRDDFESDRRYRLLAAVASRSEVEPMPPWRASLFSEEQELGSLPMDQAFQKLAEVEPRLLDIQQRVKRPGTRLEENGSLPKGISHDLRLLVGGAAERENALLRSNLASSVAHQYLNALLNPSVMGSVHVSYWSASHKLRVVNMRGAG